MFFTAWMCVVSEKKIQNFHIPTGVGGGEFLISRGDICCEVEIVSALRLSAMSTARKNGFFSRISQQPLKISIAKADEFFFFSSSLFRSIFIRNPQQHQQHVSILTLCVSPVDEMESKWTLKLFSLCFSAARELANFNFLSGRIMNDNFNLKA